MKKMIAALAAFGLASVFTACDSGTTNAKPTKGQECANGISAECLVGEWAMNGLANKVSGELSVSYNYTTAPGKLIFSEDGSYQFFAPATAPADVKMCDGGYGTWSVADGSLTMRATVKTECVDMKTFKNNTYVSKPQVAVKGATVEMVFDGLFYFLGGTDEAEIKTQYGESYSISAN